MNELSDPKYDLNNVISNKSIYRFCSIKFIKVQAKKSSHNHISKCFFTKIFSYILKDAEDVIEILIDVGFCHNYQKETEPNVLVR